MKTETVQGEILELRSAIDDVDGEIRLLLIRRKQISESIRRVKLHHGEGLVDLKRESEIFDQYRSVLGTHYGLNIAHAILDFSKS